MVLPPALDERLLPPVGLRRGWCGIALDQLPDARQRVRFKGTLRLVARVGRALVAALLIRRGLHAFLVEDLRGRLQRGQRLLLRRVVEHPDDLSGIRPVPAWDIHQ